MPPIARPLLLCLLCLPAAGCALPDWGTSLPPRRALGADLPAAQPPAGRIRAAAGETASARAPQEPDPAEHAGPLTLRRAVLLALRCNPQLAGQAWQVRMAEADELQAALVPNPELAVEMENFAGTNELKGTDSLETTVAVSQVIELGGKRQRRRALARQDSLLAGWDYEARRIALIAKVTKRYIAVLAARENVALAERTEKLAQAGLAAAQSQVRAGKAAATETSKARVQSATAKARTRRARRELAAARQDLAALWACDKPHFARATGRLDKLRPPPALADLERHLADHPDLARWDDEIRQRKAALDLARAQATPDVNVGVGYRHMNDSKDQAMLLTLGVPLPVFDRNQGEVAKARFAVLKARTDRQAAEMELRSQLVTAYEQLRGAYEEARAYEEEILPAARNAHQAARTSFDRGKSDYLHVLDAERTLAEAQELHVRALREYHEAVAEAEGLIAAPLSHPAGAKREDKESDHANESNPAAE